jgi:tetratricopeptide (TPR) repeat protein
LEKCRKADYRAALIDYDAALRINPANAWALYGRGVARVRSGDIRRGNNDLQKANELDPSIPKAYEEIGVTP